MSVRVCTLYSGSSANSTFIEVNGHPILVDAGGGVRKTEEALSALGSSLSKVEAVFITHEHSDHINGLKTILKSFRIPVIANRRTLDAIERAIPDIDSSLFRCMPTGAKAVRGDFEVISSPTSHDAVESVCYVIKTSQGNVGVITDLGEYSPDIMAAVGCCNTVILEANHDTDMLWNGSYSYPLKRRVFGQTGHLSNLQSGELLSAVCATGIKNVLLAHLSLENNTPPLALDTVVKAVSKTGAYVTDTQNGGDIYISVAPRNTKSALITF